MGAPEKGGKVRRVNGLMKRIDNSGGSHRVPSGQPGGVLDTSTSDKPDKRWDMIYSHRACQEFFANVVVLENQCFEVLAVLDRQA